MSIGSRAEALTRQLGRTKQATPPNKLPRIGEHEIMLTGQHELPLHITGYMIASRSRLVLPMETGGSSISVPMSGIAPGDLFRGRDSKRKLIGGKWL